MRTGSRYLSPVSEANPRPVTALTIAGSDSGGGAGLQADLKTFLACGVHGMAAITAVTVQNSLGVSEYHEIPAGIVGAQIESVASDIGVGAAKTGMLASTQIITAVAETLRRLPRFPLVGDPVAASQHGDPLLTPAALDAVRTQLLPLATLVTPNLYEARLLTGRRVEDEQDMVAAARALHALGCGWVLVKGGHLAGPDAVDVLFDGEDVIRLSGPRHPSRHTHGSGDTLAAATCSALARGLAVPDAVRFGKRFVTRSVGDSFPLGAGLGPVGHFWRVSADPV